jgi:hypothetical protein
MKIDINYVGKFIETCVLYRPVFHALSTLLFFILNYAFTDYNIKLFYRILGPALSPLGR